MTDRTYKPTYGQPGAPLLVSLEFEIARGLLFSESFLQGQAYRQERLHEDDPQVFVHIERSPEELAQRAADIAESLCKTAFEREWVQVAQLNPPEAAGSEAPFIVGGGRRQ